ncbi:MAG: ATPase domain-containing protein [Nitrososphaerota archaeon]|nr:ATPase domain-containing protein [Nitrososphaerota archaeon]
MNPTGIPGFDELVGGIPKGELVIVAGGPGTGKTIFSSSFLYWGAVKYGERGVYVSFAEDRNAFMRNMRGLGFDFEKLEQEGLFRFLDLLTLMEAGTSELFEVILNEVSSFGAQRLVIDSLTAIVQGMTSPRELRVFLHSLLSRIMKSMNCTTILIEEVPVGGRRIGYGFEEFVASAVILLERTHLKDKFLRRLRIIKLRGAEIPNPRACFTLKNGFKAFPPSTIKLPEKALKIQPLPDPPGAHSTGIRDLDELLGGYPKAGLALLEVDARIGPTQLSLIVDPTMINALQNGKPVILIPPVTMGLENLKTVFSHYGAPIEEFEAGLRIILAKGPGEKYGAPNYLITHRGESLEITLERLAFTIKELVKRAGKPPICILSSDALAFHYGSQGVLQTLHRLIAVAKETDGLILCVMESTFPELAQSLPPLSSIYLRLTRKHGCFLLYGVKPRTQLLAVEADISDGNLVTRLTPIL